MPLLDILKDTVAAEPTETHTAKVIVPLLTIQLVKLLKSNSFKLFNQLWAIPPKVRQSTLKHIQSTHPKEYYQILKIQGRLKKDAKVATALQHLKADLHPPISVSQYFEGQFFRADCPLILAAPSPPSNSKVIFTNDDIVKGINRLGRNKAPGVDALTDKFLRVEDFSDEVKFKLGNVFTDWFNGKPIPSYMKAAKIYAFSKEATHYPSLG